MQHLVKLPRSEAETGRVAEPQSEHWCCPVAGGHPVRVPCSRVSRRQMGRHHRRLLELSLPRHQGSPALHDGAAMGQVRRVAGCIKRVLSHRGRQYAFSTCPWLSCAVRKCRQLQNHRRTPGFVVAHFPAVSLCHHPPFPSTYRGVHVMLPACMPFARTQAVGLQDHQHRLHACVGGLPLQKRLQRCQARHCGPH